MSSTTAEFSVTFIRGPRQQTSPFMSSPYVMHAGLVLFCTLYREKDGTVQSKMATVVVKQKLKNGNETEFAKFDFDLANYAGFP